MTISLAAKLLREALIHALVASSPVLVVSLVVGLTIGIIQTTTSVQEQTLSFVPKIIFIFLVLILVGVPIIQYMVEYTRQLFILISSFPR